MKIAILDSCYSENKQASRGMGAKYLAYELQKRQIKEYQPAESDIILVSCTCTEDSKYLKKIKQKYPNKLLIAGGAASTSPYWLGKYADIVCVGDGQKFLNLLLNNQIGELKKLSNVWVDCHSNIVEIDQGFPYDLPPLQCEDGAYRVFCGRGCKNKCFFCQTGWANSYSENPNPQKLIQQAKNLINQNKKIAYLSNDPLQHSFYSLLPKIEHGSYSVNFIKKTGLPHARQIRLGVEGVSERLRKFVNKPISYEDLLNCTIWLNNNKKSVRWFMIAGLPGETKQDWEELKQIILDYKKHTTKGVLALSFTAWCPDPATPLAILPVNDDYWENFTGFKEWFFGGKGWSNRVKIMMPQQPKTRIEKALYSMGLSEQQLREGGHISPNFIRLNYPYKEQTLKIMEKLTGITPKLVS